MSAELTIVVGLPGSGKTHRMRSIKRRTTGLCVDDYMMEAHDPWEIGRSYHFNDSCHYKKLVSDLRRGLRCAISDIIFCDTMVRLETAAILNADVPKIQISWEFFANTQRKCLANARRRRRDTLSREEQLIKLLAAKYIIPKGYKPHKVWSPQ